MTLDIRPVRKFLALLCVALLAGMAPRVARADAHPMGYQHIAPLPDSRLVPPQTGITIRWGGLLDPATVDPGGLAVTGSSSGAHSGALVLADDGRTLFFRPDRPFAPGEIVSVSLRRGIRVRGGGGLPPLDFRFTVAVAQPLREPRALYAEELPRFLAGTPPGTPGGARRASPLRPPASPTTSGPVPAGYPTVNLMLADHPDPGVVFLAPFTVNFNTARGNLVIVDNRGEPVFYRSWPSTVFDFKRQPNGLLTFFTQPSPRFLAMDSTYTVVDSFAATNGYGTDEHDLQLLPNGHALFMALDGQFYPMDTVVVGGNPHAIVIGCIIQELDASKNVVFQWRSWDHFLVTDKASCAASLFDSTVDYVHANAIELDADGNLLLSSRHLNEITKIDHQTGDVIWRMGLNARNNQFTFIDDTRGFSNQHDIRRQPDGHLTLFDNGNCLSPSFSRLVEYEVDEVNKTARLVWQYRTTPDTYTPFMGNQQRREGGGITGGWGGTATNPKVVELHGDGSLAYELGLGGPFWWTYRAFRFPWQTTAFVTDRDTLDFGATTNGGPPRWLQLTNHLATPLTIGSVLSTNPRFAPEGPLPLTLSPGATDSIAVRFIPVTAEPESADLYVRALSDTDLIARVVRLAGVASGPLLYIDDVKLPEGESGATTFTFTVRLDRPLEQAVTFDYTTVDSSAASVDLDFADAAGTKSIAAGDSTVDIDITVFGDPIYEPNEVFHVVISNASNAFISRETGRGIILNDDPSVVSVPHGTPAQFVLHPAAPDPASNGATIRFDLPRESEVSLEVFDLHGRRVAVLASGSKPAGRASVWWDTRGQPAGLYFIRMRAGAFHATRRLVLRR